MKTLLVTGAYGFVGRHVARAAAAQGYRVIGIGHGNWDRHAWRQWGLQDWHADDVTVETLATYAGQPDVIVHCAGSGSVGFSMTAPVLDFNRTVTTTLSVLEFIRQSAPDARLVLPSSAGIYGKCADLPIRIDSAKSPSSPYGLHKLMAEQLCQSYATHYNVKSAIVRLFSVYGTGLRKQLLWDACCKISAGHATFFGTGEETRDWIHIEDAAGLLLAAVAHAGADCPIANGGTGLAIAIRSILTQLCDALGTGLAPGFDGAQRAGDPMHYQADISQALAWGWKPGKNLAEQLRAYAIWFREEQL